MKLYFKDKHGNPIDTEKIYCDNKYDAINIHITKIGNTWYAHPDKLSPELLLNVCMYLEEQEF